MCTAISFNAYNHYFGRNLDLERRYNESVVITPRNYILRYKSGNIERRHFAFIGTATIIDDYPLYYDATNEYGLSIAGLNFVGNAYLEERPLANKTNLAPYELIPYVLAKCKNVGECLELLSDVALVDIRFRDDLPNSELHWMICDSNESVVFECMEDGAKIYRNTIGVLTNNPPYNYHMMSLNNYINISNSTPKNNFSGNVELLEYSRGMGGIGLPGDHSSLSRFIRAAFTKLNSVIPNSELESVSQMFHILCSVEQQEGCVKVGDGFERTQYTSCCNSSEGIYYYRTYNNSQITAVRMRAENLESETLVFHKMLFEPTVNIYN